MENGNQILEKQSVKVSIPPKVTYHDQMIVGIWDHIGYPNFQLVFVNQIHYHDKTKLVCYNIMCIIYVKSSLLE